MHDRFPIFLQDSYIFDGLSLEDNITLGKALDKLKMEQVLDRVNLAFLKGHLLYGEQLSGGEKQRLEIARSLYHNSDLILADEVKANLDKENARQIYYSTFLYKHLSLSATFG